MLKRSIVIVALMAIATPAADPGSRGWSAASSRTISTIASGDNTDSSRMSGMSSASRM